MGNDGGSIPGRQDLVKEKKKKKRYQNELTKTSKAKYCSLSKEALKKPIVGCKLGMLYNKEQLIRALLDKKMPKTFRHITSLKDVKELNVTFNEKPAENQSEQNILCPITMLEFNGMNTFFFLWKCGCVFSRKASEELNLKESCIVCGEKINISTDLINMNMSKEEKENLYDILTAEKMRNKKPKTPEEIKLLGKKRELIVVKEKDSNEVESRLSKDFVKHFVTPLGQMSTTLSSISSIQK